MPWVSGLFSRVDGAATWVNDRDAAILINAPDHDTHDQDLADGVNNCLTKDGQNSATANINLGNNRITNVATPTAANDAATKAYVDGSSFLASGDQILHRGSVPAGFVAVALDNYALRVNNTSLGSGGSNTFTGVLNTSVNVSSESGHTHGFTSGTTSSGTISCVGGSGNLVTPDHTHSGTTGAGNAHNHNFNLNVRYYDMRVIQKS